MLVIHNLASSNEHCPIQLSSVASGLVGDDVGVMLGAGKPVESGTLAGIGNDDDGLDAGQPGQHLAQLVEAVELLAAVKIPFGGDQRLRCDLPEAVEDTLGAEIGRTGRPDRAHARRRQHGDDGLGRVRRV